MNAVEALRTRLNWSQAQIAEYAGCHQSTIHRIEDGGEPNPAVSRMLDRLDVLVANGEARSGMCVKDVVDLAIGRRQAASGTWGDVEVATIFDDSEVAKVGGGL